MWETFVYYLACGVVAGLSAGMFGVGGGIVVVPFLAWRLPLQGIPERLVMLMAVATSLATIVVTSISAVLAHHRRHGVRWLEVRRLMPGIISGSLAGAVLAERLPVTVFKAMFGVFLMFVAVRMSYRVDASRSCSTKISVSEYLAAGGVIGLVSAVLGIGGGTLSVPYLVRRGLPIQNAVAVSNACGLPIAIAGAATYMLVGWNRPDLPPMSAGYIFLPAFVGIVLTSVPFAPVGARLAHSVSTRLLKMTFAILLALVGLRIVWQGLALSHIEIASAIKGVFDRLLSGSPGR